MKSLTRNKAFAMLVVTLSLCWFHSCDATRLLPQWCTKIIELCDGFDDVHPTPPTVNGMLYLHSLQESSCSPVMYLFPPVILWSPLEQFRDSLRVVVKCPKCTVLGHNNITLSATGWRNGGHGARSEPRKIYGSDGVCLLVGRVYRCSMGHEVVGYHPGILEQIPTCFIPFKLWHITGFTMELIDFTVALITAGMSVGGVRALLHRKQMSLYYNRLRQFEQVAASVKEDLGMFPTLDIWRSCFSSSLPSMHALSSCFLADFWTKDKAYTQCMRNTTINEEDPWLSLDHTFSSASKEQCCSASVCNIMAIRALL